MAVRTQAYGTDTRFRGNATTANSANCKNGLEITPKTSIPERCQYFGVRKLINNSTPIRGSGSFIVEKMLR
jgi:hypothetical protein